MISLDDLPKPGTDAFNRWMSDIESLKPDDGTCPICKQIIDPKPFAIINSVRICINCEIERPEAVEEFLNHETT